MNGAGRWLTYRARDGIVKTHLDYDGGLPAFERFVRNGLEMSSQYSPEKCPDHIKVDEYKFLDSFFSDSMSTTLFQEALRTARDQRCDTKILLVDPRSDQARIRAASIKQDLKIESSRGLLNILTALHRMLNTHLPNDVELMSTRDLMELTCDIGEINNISIRFYSDSPSGPMYFLRNLLLCGRFNAGKTAAHLPWTMIANDPYVSGDLYDVQNDEFNYVWERATKAL